MKANERHSRLCELLAGRRCFGGMDLSATSDMTALGLWFPPLNDSEGAVHFFLVWLFLPEANILDLEQKSRAPYTQWARDGWLELTPGQVVDYKVIRQWVNRLGSDFDVVNWRYDPHNATALVTDLAEEDGINMVEFGQGYGWMSPPTKDVEKLLIERRIRHAGNPAMGWMMGNCQFDRDSTDRIKIVKLDKKKLRRKVDGPIVLVMSRDGAMRDVGGSMMLSADDLVVGG